MQIVGPYCYEIQFTPEALDHVIGPNGVGNFVAPVTHPVHKLYIVSNVGIPVYVGATRQPIRTRLNQGFQADINNGYRGYLWRHALPQANLDNWTLEIWILEVEELDIQQMGDDPSIVLAGENRDREEYIVVEALEAEVAFLTRQAYGHWPTYQSEIHFHQPGANIYDAAQQVMNHYGEVDA